MAPTLSVTADQLWDRCLCVEKTYLSIFSWTLCRR